ncbi:MAG: UvrD-helicase domain-containing protein, partial [Holosporales bacterium]|nr:UvrD-helicase domain-containing protein [Holosporales bacterium]
MLFELNDEQRAAVQTTEGAVLIVAGAGTGKTKVLTSRIAYIVSQNLCSIDEVLAVTFTNKAAKEMLTRTLQLLDSPDLYYTQPWIGTFHSIALKMIRPHHDKFQRSANFTILDSDDQQRIIKKIMQEYNMDYKKYTTKAVSYYINRWKDLGNTSYSPASSNKKFLTTEEIARKIYSNYQDTLRSLDALDFGDILAYCIEIFKSDTSILEHFQKRFKYIMVDEYQDTNAAQYIWLRLISMGHGNICCVGDDDQAIYSWRGADISNILKFNTDFKNSKIVRLGKNYRSTKNILQTANSLISNNSMRMEKTFWTDEEAGLPVIIKVLSNPVEEAHFIASLIINKHNNGVAFKDMAILIRAAFQTLAFEERFLSIGIPYTVIGGIKFYERKEVKDSIAYLRLIVNPNDGVAFERIVNVPKRNIGPVAINKFYEIAREHNISLPEAASDFGKLSNFFKMLEQWRKGIDFLSIRELMEKVLNESGYIDMLKESKNLEDEARLETLDELLKSLDSFQNIAEFLEYVSLVFDNTDTRHLDNVVISTIHAAKGLEYRTVFRSEE